MIGILALMILTFGAKDNALMDATTNARVQQCESYLWNSSERKAKSQGWSLNDVSIQESQWFGQKIHEKCQGFYGSHE